MAATLCFLKSIGTWQGHDNNNQNKFSNNPEDGCNLNFDFANNIEMNNAANDTWHKHHEQQQQQQQQQQQHQHRHRQWQVTTTKNTGTGT